MYEVAAQADPHERGSWLNGDSCKPERQQPLAASRHYLALQFNEMPMSPGFPPDQSTIWNFIR